MNKLYTVEHTTSRLKTVDGQIGIVGIEEIHYNLKYISQLKEVKFREELTDGFKSEYRIYFIDSKSPLLVDREDFEKIKRRLEE